MALHCVFWCFLVAKPLCHTTALLLDLNMGGFQLMQLESYFLSHVFVVEGSYLGVLATRSVLPALINSQTDHIPHTDGMMLMLEVRKVWVLLSIHLLIQGPGTSRLCPVCPFSAFVSRFICHSMVLSGLLLLIGNIFSIPFSTISKTATGCVRGAMQGSSVVSSSAS